MTNASKTLHNKHIIVIVTSSIAAYKTPDIIRALIDNNARVTVVMTTNATKFISPVIFQAISCNLVHHELITEHSAEMLHIQLARQADMILVAPATASFIGKIANGIADDLASTIIITCNKPVLIAPAMNPSMWNNIAVQRNVDTIKSDGKIVMHPSVGVTACGEYGIGRMPDYQSILHEIETALQNDTNKQRILHNNISIFKNKTVLITAGSTQEPIDHVRYLSNYSSGKTGIEIAKVFYELGAKVLIVTGKSNILSLDNDLRYSELTNIYEKDKHKIHVYNIQTAQQLHSTVMSLLPVDVFISAAAVSDWRIKHIFPGKMHNPDRNHDLTISFIKNPDVLEAVSGSPEEKRPKVVIGFALESDDVVNKATLKLHRKGCDAIVANEISMENSPFGDRCNVVTWIDKHKVVNMPSMSKRDIAVYIAERCEEFLL